MPLVTARSASVLTAVLLLLPVSSRSRAEGGIVAVFDIEDRGSGLAAGARSNIVDHIVVVLTQRGFQVIPRDQIRERLRREKIESYRECYDQNCQIELGRELAAQKSLAPVLTRIEDRCRLALVLYDLRKAVTENAASIDCACSEAVLLEAVSRAVAGLIRPDPGAAPPGVEAAAGRRQRHLLSLGLSAGLVFPSLLLVGLNEPQDMWSRLEFGGLGTFQALLHWRFMAVGLRVGFAAGRATPDGGSYLTTPGDLDFNHLMIEGTVVGELDLDSFGLRLGAGVGYHSLGGGIVEDYINQVKSDGDRIGGLGLSLYLQGYLPLGERFSLLLEFGAFASGFRPETYDVPPVLYLNAGVQYGL